MSNQIYFNLDDKNGVKVSFKQSVPFTEFLQIVSTGVLAAMNAVVASTPDAQKQIVKEDLYDMLNTSASNVLSFFAPEIEMRPHLTTQAILEAENNLIRTDPAFVNALITSELPKAKDKYTQAVEKQAKTNMVNKGNKNLRRVK